MSTSGSGLENREPSGASNKPEAIFKIVLGLAFVAATVYLADLHAGKEPSAGSGAVSGIAAGIALWLLLAGAGQLMRKRLAMPVGIAVLVLCAVAGGFIEPRMVASRRVQIELAAWDRLQASGKTYKDFQEYEYNGTTRRRGYLPGMALAQVREEVARQQAGKFTGSRVETLRHLISECHSKGAKEEPGAMQPAIDLARAEIARAYAKGLEDLTKRVDSGKAAEFEKDPQMRSAFQRVLERLAAADDDRVYLVFISDINLRPDEADLNLQMLDSGEAFSSVRDDKRRYAFIKAMERALKEGFVEPLVRVQELDKGVARKGKIVFEVHCATRRVRGGMELTINDSRVGSLFNLDVGWKFQFFDIDEKPLAVNQTHSNPAKKLSFDLKKGDPNWAGYSVMMDSAYYNFCRQIIGRLGMVPPSVQESFTFER